VFCEAKNTPKFIFGRGFVPNPAGVAYDATPGPRPPNQPGREIPSPPLHSTPASHPSTSSALEKFSAGAHEYTDAVICHPSGNAALD